MKNILIIALFSFLGGIVGSVVLNVGTSYASKEERFYTTNFYNNDGKRIGVIGAHASGEGTLFLMNGNTGKTEIQMGAYGHGGERGQTLLGLHDRNGHLRHLTRMHGATDAPTVVMKDNTGTDRIVFGIDPQSQAPYFRYLDRSGNMKNLF